MPTAFSLAKAGGWFLNSGIQEASGGVARFYRSEIGKNRPVSTEITGYTASTLVYLYKVTGEAVYLERASKTAAFLVERAWDPALGTFPFEHPSPSAESEHRAWFFDCGMILRGLLAVWRETHRQRLIEIAWAAAKGMIADFHAGADYHPVIELPGKTPAERNEHWSRSPGCYQLKSAMAWVELAEVTGSAELRAAYEEILAMALATASEYLDSVSGEKRMDRLHPFCYFLEGLTPVLDRKHCREAYARGIEEAERHLREIAPSFVRSDVYAQLLRVRICGDGAVPVDRAAAFEEARALAEFQIANDDPRVDGGFAFGRRGDKLSPHINPVSTAFALQALELWREFEAGTLVTGENSPCRRLLI